MMNSESLETSKLCDWSVSFMHIHNIHMYNVYACIVYWNKVYAYIYVYTLNLMIEILLGCMFWKHFEIYFANKFLNVCYIFCGWPSETWRLITVDCFIRDQFFFCYSQINNEKWWGLNWWTYDINQYWSLWQDYRW